MGVIDFFCVVVVVVGGGGGVVVVVVVAFPVNHLAIYQVSNHLPIQPLQT